MEITFGYQKNLVICSNSDNLSKTWSQTTHESKIMIPDLEVLPYDNFSPHPEVSSRRLIGLRDLVNKNSIVAFSTIPALFQPIFDRANINTLFFEFKEKQIIDRDELVSKLLENGYEAADLVSKPSSFALRGSVVDIFPSNSKYPVRIDLDDDYISSIFIFDPDSQKTFRKISSFIVRPSKGFVLDDKSIKIFKVEYPILILSSILGMMVMVSSNDLIVFYIGLELQSLALYVLASFNRDNILSSESGLKYFVLSALSSGLLLYGCSLVYGFSSSTNFSQIAFNYDQSIQGITFGMVFILVGLLI